MSSWGAMIQATAEDSVPCSVWSLLAPPLAKAQERPEPDSPLSLHNLNEVWEAQGPLGPQ